MRQQQDDKTHDTNGYKKPVEHVKHFPWESGSSTALCLYVVPEHVVPMSTCSAYNRNSTSPITGQSYCA